MGIEELSKWLTMIRDRLDSQVHVRVSARGETRVTIDHRLPCDLDEYDGWHVHTRKTLLPSSHFTSQVLHKVRTASHLKGRSLYCVDSLTQEVVAVAAYHIPAVAGWPVFLTALGFRVDATETETLTRRTIAGALVLKAHLHSVSAKIGRGGYIDIDPVSKDNQRHASELGFRKAPKIRGYPPKGLHMRQES